MLYICVFILLYFLCAFLLYAFPDFWHWRISSKRQFGSYLTTTILQHETDAAKAPDPRKIKLDEKTKEYIETIVKSWDKKFFPVIRSAPHFLRIGMHYLRVFFEFGFPVLLALYSILLLLSKAADIKQL